MITGEAARCSEKAACEAPGELPPLAGLELVAETTPAALALFPGSHLGYRAC